MLVSESVSQAVAEAFDAAREQNSDNIEELLAGTKDAAERQKDEAVKDALSSASLDFKNQMLTALSAMRDTLTRENQREIAAVVAKTDALRAETISLCERNLEESRLSQYRDRQALAQSRAEVRKLREMLQSHGISTTVGDDGLQSNFSSSISSPPPSKKPITTTSSSPGDNTTTSSSYSNFNPTGASSSSSSSTFLSSRLSPSNNVKPPSLFIPQNTNNNRSEDETGRNVPHGEFDHHNGRYEVTSSSSSSTSNIPPPPKPPAVSQRLYETILSLPILSLRTLLDKAGIPNRDVTDKVDLMTRLLIAVEKGATVYSSNTNNSSSATGGEGRGIMSDLAEGERLGGIPMSSPIGTEHMESFHNNHHPHHHYQQQQQNRPKTPDSQVRVVVSSSPLANGGGGKSSDSPHIPTASNTNFSNNALSPERKMSSPLDHQQQQQQTYDSSLSSSSSTSKVSSPAELKNWLPVRGDDGSTYYYHKVTRVTRWDRPEVEVARRVEERIKGETEATKARQQERLAALQAEEQARVAAAAARFRNESDIETKVTAWNNKHKGGVRSLLASLSSILNGTSLSSAIPEEILQLVGPSAGSSYSEESLRKAYKMALRVVHPDKVESSRPEEELLAQKVFSTLADAYKKYSAGGGGGESLYTFPSSSTSSSIRTGGGGGGNGGKYMGVNAPTFEGINTKNVMEAAAARARASMAAIQKEQMAQQAKRAAAVSGGGGGSGGVGGAKSAEFDPLKIGRTSKASNANAPYGFGGPRR